MVSLGFPRVGVVTQIGGTTRARLSGNTRLKSQFARQRPYV